MTMRAEEIETLTRFIDARGDSVDARIGELFRGVERPEPLAPAELARVHARLTARPASTPKPIRYVALLATGMLAGTGFAFAAYGVQRLVESPSAASTTPVSAPPAPARMPNARSHGTETPPAVVEETPSHEAPKRSVAAYPEASSGALGRESELLARALVKLRRDRDATAALTLLDEHAKSFPNGALRLESDVARVDALWALGRSAEALALLERLPIDRLGRGAELRVIRGELFAQRDPQKAIGDFDRALATGLPGELEERALFGRAASRLRAGDEAGGRADLATYLLKYPNGRFAAQARRF
jgi:tetratricopeptide (TPR) repeat protein